MGKESKVKRIYNPVTRRYYVLRRRTTKGGRKGQIKGLWKPPKEKKETLLEMLFG